MKINISDNFSSNNDAKKNNTAHVPTNIVTIKWTNLSC